MVTSLLIVMNLYIMWQVAGKKGKFLLGLLVLAAIVTIIFVILVYFGVVKFNIDDALKLIIGSVD